MIKIDLQKAYDSVEWPYLEQVMVELGFPYKFISWIMACVTTVNYTILFNGETSEPFNAAKGLRQGDPISPFLFAIAMEYLIRGLNSLKMSKEFKFHPRCAKLGVTHLCFADDLRRGDLPSITALNQCFNTFSRASGLQSNIGKSSIYFGGVTQGVKDNILKEMGFVLSELPFKYLGIPLSTKKLSLLQWQPLIDKITTWTAKKLSYAGRIQLVQSVVFGMQSYWAQLFPLLAHVIKIIDAFCRSYVWTGSNVISKKALVSWERMCSPKSAGGLNLINIKVWN